MKTKEKITRLYQALSKIGIQLDFTLSDISEPDHYYKVLLSPKKSPGMRGEMELWLDNPNIFREKWPAMNNEELTNNLWKYFATDENIITVHKLNSNIVLHVDYFFNGLDFVQKGYNPHTKK